jgi:NADPH:quinone reductase-like Zn-dependent oxidoreductase
MLPRHHTRRLRGLHKADAGTDTRRTLTTALQRTASHPETTMRAFAVFAAASACTAAVASAFAPAPMALRRATAAAPSAASALRRHATTEEGKGASLRMPTKIESPDVDSTAEAPKINGGIVIGLRKLVVITGASSGLGLQASLSLAKKGGYYVVMACRDVQKGNEVAKAVGMPFNSYTVSRRRPRALAAPRRSRAHPVSSPSLLR